MRYHIYKASRVYEGRPYSGPTSDGQPAQADQLCEAVKMWSLMCAHNPVGWRIRDTQINQDVNPE